MNSLGAPTACWSVATQARFRDPNKTLDNFDFTFNFKLSRSLVFDLATGGFIAKRHDALAIWPGYRASCDSAGLSLS
jgi:hypothetical protein